MNTKMLKSHEGINIMIAVTYQGYRFNADFAMGDRMKRGIYESQEISLISKIPNLSKMSVLELGGCLGVLAVIVNKKLDDPNKHIVIEANPKLINNLEHNRNINNAKFTILNALISNNSNDVFYSYDKVVAGSSHRMDDREENKTQHKVDVITLPNLMKKFDIKFDVILIDIEGGELQFLQELLCFNIFIKYIMVEIHEFIMYAGYEQECLDVLNKLGLKLIAKDGISFLFSRP
ncbi:MAG: FkbM family methyltransferase [Glaciecola sp.]|jgi:FkbM family methyltransferase